VAELDGELRSYFPAALRDRLAAQIATHPLHREITATVVTNDLVNRAGMTFVDEMQARTGRTASDAARAYMIVRNVFNLTTLWAEIEALDNKVTAALQIEMLLEIIGVIEHAAVWLLRTEKLAIGREALVFTPAVARLASLIADLLPTSERALMEARSARLAAAGVPPPLAARIGAFIFLTTAFEVCDLAARVGQPVERVAQTFYEIGGRFAFDDLRAAGRRLPTDSVWQKASADALIDDFYAMQAEATDRVLRAVHEAKDPVAVWVATRAGALAPVQSVARELRAAAIPDLAMLVVASRQLRQVLG
jgi:glutamate dehydrogenase